MGVSENSGFSQIIHFNRVFHYKPSILGYLYFLEIPISCGGKCLYHFWFYFLKGCIFFLFRRALSKSNVYFAYVCGLIFNGQSLWIFIRGAECLFCFFDSFVSISKRNCWNGRGLSEQSDDSSIGHWANRCCIYILYINSNLPANCKMMSTVCDSCLDLVFCASSPFTNHLILSFLKMPNMTQCLVHQQPDHTQTTPSDTKFVWESQFLFRTL